MSLVLRTHETKTDRSTHAWQRTAHLVRRSLGAGSILTLMLTLLVTGGCSAGVIQDPDVPDPPVPDPTVPNPPLPGPQASDTSTLTVRYTMALQTIAGFGATTVPLVYAGVDYLGSLRGEAIQAVFGQVGINRGSLSIGTVETPADAADPFGQRANDNGDPLLANAAGFNFVGSATLRNSILIPAAAYGFNTLDLGQFLQLRGSLDWMVAVRTANYDRYLDEAAEHVLVVMQNWRAAYGSTPRLLHLFNEPTTGNKELASTSTQEMVDLVKRVGARLRAGGFAEVQFIVPNEETMARSLVVARAMLGDPVARQFVGAIGFHQYPYRSAYSSPRRILESSGAGTPDGAARLQMEQLRDLGAQYGVPLWMTEVAEGPGIADYSFAAIENVLARTIHIHDVFRYAGASAFFGMQAMWDSRSHAEHFAGRNIPFLIASSAMVLVDVTNRTIWITGMGYAVGHYARWVKPGTAVLQSISSNPQVLVTGFRDTERNRVVVVATNANATPQLLRVRIEGATLTGAMSGEASHGDVRWTAITGARLASDGMLEVVAPARSVVSLALPLQ